MWIKKWKFWVHVVTSVSYESLCILTNRVFMTWKNCVKNDNFLIASIASSFIKKCFLFNNRVIENCIMKQICVFEYYNDFCQELHKKSRRYTISLQEIAQELRGIFEILHIVQENPRNIFIFKTAMVLMLKFLCNKNSAPLFVLPCISVTGTLKKHIGYLKHIFFKGYFFNT